MCQSIAPEPRATGSLCHRPKGGECQVGKTGEWKRLTGLRPGILPGQGFSSSAPHPFLFFSLFLSILGFPLISFEIAVLNREQGHRSRLLKKIQFLLLVPPTCPSTPKGISKSLKSDLGLCILRKFLKEPRY